MLGLKLPTDVRWARLAEEDLHALLTDHAWCEHKAAANALSLINRYPQHPAMAQELARIAMEEIDHFGQVLAKVVARGWTLGPERKDDYVNAVLAFVRRDGTPEERLVDRLLFSAMIEARSCERFKLLATTVKDEDLRTFYHELMVSEAGHYTTFIGFARRYGGSVDVEARWKAFLDHEAGVVAQFGEAPTIHG